MEPWAPENIERRIVDRLAELGMKMNDLPQTIDKTFKNGWKQGPTFKTLMKTADKLRMSLPELLGVSAEGGRIDPEILRQSLRVMEHAGRASPLAVPPDKLAPPLAEAYRLISDMVHEDPALAFSDGALFSVASRLRYLFASPDSQKS